MKRFFCLFLVALVCISLCVNIAFASDVVTARVDQNILVYFPWFGGVSGSSASRVTNYATVTTSDVTSSSVTVDQIANYRSNTYNGVSFSGNGAYLSLTGTSTYTGRTYVTTSMAFTSGHKYFVYTSGLSLPLYVMNSNIGYTFLGNVGSNFIYDCTYTGGFYFYLAFTEGVTYNDQVALNVFDLTQIFGSGNEPADPASALTSLGVTIPCAAGSYVVSNISSFSLVPAPASNGGSSSHQTNDYTWYQYSADISLDGNNAISGSLSQYMFTDLNDPYVLWGVVNSINLISDVYYTRQSAYDNYSGTLNKTLLSFDNTFNYARVSYISIEINPALYPYFLETNPTGLNYSVWCDRIPIASYGTYDSNNYLLSISSDLLDYLDSDQVIGYSNGSYTGTFTIDRIFQMNDNSYFLFNNQVNLGTYDFNVNVKFPSLDKFNSFSGYWMASFNTSWGEIPVRTEIQEVSSNSDTLIKIYKLTFDVPFTGQYTKFNIKFVGDSSAFTTIRVDASVIDPNGYQNGAGPTTINGFSFYLTSMFDKFWGKIRSLFFDQDQTYEQVAQSSVSSELAGDAAEVSEGASTIHEYETENFDSIEQQMDSLDWDIPNDFGSADDPSSAIGFISTFFGGIFLALGSKVQVLIVIPLMLGLCLLILGRGSQALGAINKLFR